MCSEQRTKPWTETWAWGLSLEMKMLLAAQRTGMEETAISKGPNITATEAVSFPGCQPG